MVLLIVSIQSKILMLADSFLCLKHATSIRGNGSSLFVTTFACSSYVYYDVNVSSKCHFSYRVAAETLDPISQPVFAINCQCQRHITVWFASMSDSADDTCRNAKLTPRCSITKQALQEDLKGVTAALTDGLQVRDIDVEDSTLLACGAYNDIWLVTLKIMVIALFSSFSHEAHFF